MNVCIYKIIYINTIGYENAAVGCFSACFWGCFTFFGDFWQFLTEDRQKITEADRSRQKKTPPKISLRKFN